MVLDLDGHLTTVKAKELGIPGKRSGGEGRPGGKKGGHRDSETSRGGEKANLARPFHWLSNGIHSIPTKGWGSEGGVALDCRTSVGFWDVLRLGVALRLDTEIDGGGGIVEGLHLDTEVRDCDSPLASRNVELIGHLSILPSLEDIVPREWSQHNAATLPNGRDAGAPKVKARVP